MHCRPMYPVKSTGVREAICTPICTPIADKTMRFCAMICDNRAFGKIIKNIVKSRLASFCEDIQSYDKSTIYLPRQYANIHQKPQKIRLFQTSEAKFAPKIHLLQRTLKRYIKSKRFELS